MGPKGRFLLVFAVHLAVQGTFLVHVPERFVRPHARWEVNAVAMSLHERGTFADPYAVPTGPTAHVPPAFPAAMAGIYGLLGTTLAAGYATWALAIAGYGAMFGMLPWLGGRLGLGERAGLAAGLAGAVVPRWPGYVEGFTGAALGLLLAAFLAREEGGEAAPGRSLLLGLATGLAFHLAPTLLPVALGYLAVELARGGRRRLVPVAAVLLGAALACVPWTLRNARELGGLVFVRSNFGLELRMGNHEGAGANLALSDRAGTERHPRTDLAEAGKVAALGELGYMRAARAEAVAFIRARPGEFARLTALRVAQFWLGPVDGPLLAAATTLLTLLAVAGALRAFPRLSSARRAALLVPLAAFPLVYYVVGYEPRYREPLDGLLLLLAAAAFFRPPAGGGAGRYAGPVGPSPNEAPASASA